MKNFRAFFFFLGQGHLKYFIDLKDRDAFIKNQAFIPESVTVSLLHHSRFVL